jgi:cephalosporin-C deacetylase-like acetyl esterase
MKKKFWIIPLSVLMFTLLTAETCFLNDDEEEEKERISIDFTFEVQVMDPASIPIQNVLVYMDTRKYDNGEIKGVFEDKRTTNANGWVVKYVGYNMDEASDYAVFHASLTGWSNFDPPVVHKIVYYNDIRQAAGGDDHVNYTVTGFITKTD